MPDIQSLTVRMQGLSQSVDWWNTATIWALVFVAIAAVAVVVTTSVGLARAKQLAYTQAVLIQAKDDQFRLDIAKANERAAEANQLAEGERLERVKIQEKLAWRSLNTERQRTIVAKLKAFPGTSFQIRVFQEPEATTFMGVVQEILHSSDWIQRPPDGATRISTKYGEVGISIGAGITISTDLTRATALAPAARAFASALVDEGIEANSKSVAIELNPEIMHIDIGKKP